jgi:electron transport complex protein RnfA
MILKELILIFIATAIVNNLVLSWFLGICPYLGVSKRLDTAFGMGLAVTFVMTASGIVTWLINNIVIEGIRQSSLGLDLRFLKYMIFIFVIASMVQLVEMYVRKFFSSLYDMFGIYLPLITTNCAILGACLLIDLRSYTLLQTAVFCLGGGLGFTLAIVIMAGIREELDLADIPKPLRGPPIALIVAALLAMAFMGFAGMAG